MKKICFLFLLSVGLVLSSCKNYDDQFNALNGQITALQGQVTGLSSLQTEVTALKSTITAIQSSLSGLQGTVTTALQTAQSEITQEIKDELATGLAGVTTSLNGLNEKNDELSKKNDELSASLATLQEKLTGLETKLQAIQDSAVSEEALTKVQTDLANQLTEVKESLEKSLKESNFHTGPLDITSVGGLTFVTTQLKDKTQINGNVTIDTKGWTDEQITSLQEWVAKVTLIFGDLDITHADEDTVIKFAALTGVNTLIDKQPHAHYPELTSASEVTFAEGTSDLVKTVRLPGLTTTKFTKGTIHLKIGEELHLDTFTEHAGDLTINLGGNATVDDTELDGAITNLSLLKELKEKGTLQLIGFDTVELPALTTLKKLHVQDVNSLIAKKVNLTTTDAELQISKDVSSVDVGTEEGGAVAKINIDSEEAKRDLEELKIGGNDNLVVTIPSGVEVAHIRDAKSVETAGSDDLDTFDTAGEIKELTLTGTDIETLTLGHTSGKGGKLEIVNNASLESLTAHKVNNLKTLTIQGNTRLETISFVDGDGNGLVTAATDAVVKIGGHATPNLLRATSITLEETADKKDGKIVDESGLSDLNKFLGSNIKTAEVYYDGATQFRKSGKIEDNDPSISISSANSEDLVLFREGKTDGTSSGTNAKKVFIVYGTNATGSPTSFEIGIRLESIGTIFKTITKVAGESSANLAARINREEKESRFFDINGVKLSAETGGFEPRGAINFAYGGVSTTAITNDQITALGDGAYVELSIGPDSDPNAPEDRKVKYSHKVLLTQPSSGQPAAVKNFGKEDITKNEAISHYLLAEGNTDKNAAGILVTLRKAFPGNTNIIHHPGGTTPETTTAASRNVSVRAIPYRVEHELSEGGDSGDLIAIHTYDINKISKPIPVKFEFKNEEGNIPFDTIVEIFGLTPAELPAGGLPEGEEIANAVSEGKIYEAENIDNRYKDSSIFIIFESKVKVEDDPNIGPTQYYAPPQSALPSTSDYYSTSTGNINFGSTTPGLLTRTYETLVVSARPTGENYPGAYVFHGTPGESSGAIELKLPGAKADRISGSGGADGVRFLAWWSDAAVIGKPVDTTPDTNTGNANRLSWLQ